MDGVDPLTQIDRGVHPVDEWAWHETRPARTDDELGQSETLFALSNGYLGMRGNPPEGRDSHEHGTFINGVHETWNIEHAEDAYGFAREGQTIVQVPDAKAMRLYIDDEPLRLGVAEVEDYGRTVDFREGVERRSFIWRTQAGKRVRVVTDRMVSFQERHLALMSIEVELLDSDAAVVISSQILNRQDGEDEFSSILDTYAASSGADDRARARAAAGRRRRQPGSRPAQGGEDRGEGLPAHLPGEFGGPAGHPGVPGDELGHDRGGEHGPCPRRDSGAGHRRFRGSGVLGRGRRGGDPHRDA
ncbi:glycoside hydrolase family 65 protein [Corynebacterium provencense]|uniref:hypothetical protein n=1 Tax=Corynebacterium provencense TaxID=1737425 RepID=UPI000A7316A7|nr:hypothetical protein [Corynebacterium provencense]